ncbi:MAG: VOC family protein [Spirochaetales bacterium]|nr:VOC family protein [Spirochaetales bacterium]
MELGAFSVSLTVRDLDASSDFYEKLGFTECGGDRDKNWLMMRNGSAVIGLFLDMFGDNILTFNPGWDQSARNLDNFTDIREIQKKLKKEGIELLEETDENGRGPASISVVDPDGNMILFDQHR